MRTVQQILEAGNDNFYLINTAYPPDKVCWAPYRADTDYSAWAGEEGLGLYLHIPFCKTRCRFCEYVTMSLPDKALVEQYLNAVNNELTHYREQLPLSGKILHGFDMGGGTPTLLSSSQLEWLFTGLQPFISSLEKSGDYEQAIETNTEIACNNLPLLKTFKDLGFTRISMGIQTVSENLLADLNREYQATLAYNQAMENFNKTGFEKINLDVMYGLPGQSMKSWEETLHFILTLKADQISIYETRYKDSLLNNRCRSLNLDSLNWMYELAYDCLISAGYYGYYGSTAFTRNFNDKGLSSYLRKRTTEFIPYLGLGIGAQTMTREYLSYNFGKNSFDLAGYITEAGKGTPVEYYYKLPDEETAAKYIAISFYLGYINYPLLSARMGFDFLSLYRQQIDFLLEQDFINIDAEKITLTRRGYRKYHGIITLFYPARTLNYICPAV